MAPSTDWRFTRLLMFEAVPNSSASIRDTRDTWSLGGMMSDIIDVPLLNAHIQVTRGWALNRVHNSCQPCGAVSLSGDTAQRDSTPRLSRCNFLQFFFILWSWPLTFWPNINWWQGIMIDYPRAKFGDFSFSRFGTTDADDHYTHANYHRHEWLQQ